MMNIYIFCFKMRLRSKQRKAYDPEFHRKREVVNLNQDINKDDEIDGAGGRNFQEFNTKFVYKC